MTPMSPRMMEAVDSAAASESAAVMASAPAVPADALAPLAAVLNEAAAALGLVPPGEEAVPMDVVREAGEGGGQVIAPEPITRTLQALAVALREARSERTLTISEDMDATDVRLLIGEIRAAMADPAVRSAMARPSEVKAKTKAKAPPKAKATAAGPSVQDDDDAMALFASRMS